MRLKKWHWIMAGAGILIWISLVVGVVALIRKLIGA